MEKFEEGKLIQFENDQEFIEWAIKPFYEVIETENGGRCFSVAYTDAYINAIEEGYLIDILDEDSRINKDGLVHWGIITKPVDNLLVKTY